MRDTLFCKEAPFQPERHSKNLEQFFMIMPSERFRDDFSLGSKRRSLEVIS